MDQGLFSVRVGDLADGRREAGEVASLLSRTAAQLALLDPERPVGRSHSGVLAPAQQVRPGSQHRRHHRTPLEQMLTTRGGRGPLLSVQLSVVCLKQGEWLPAGELAAWLRRVAELIEVLPGHGFEAQPPQQPNHLLFRRRGVPALSGAGIKAHPGRGADAGTLIGAAAARWLQDARRRGARTVGLVSPSWSVDKPTAVAAFTSAALRPSELVCVAPHAAMRELIAPLYDGLCHLSLEADGVRVRPGQEQRRVTCDEAFTAWEWRLP